ncbi:MAG: ATP-binding cassette domain-containing protein, partial [candidate division WOR-3 bacterium]
AGKSTFLKLIFKAEEPSQGTIKVLGQDLSDIKKSAIPSFRRKIGVIFQDFKLLQDRTAEENIAFALEVTAAPSKDIKKKTLEMLSWLHLSHKRNSFPYQLSGGEQQKVAIGRALIREPFILLADEPTGNLDGHSALEIIELLHEINLKGAMVIMATHDLSLAKKFKRRLIKLNEGRIIADGY